MITNQGDKIEVPFTEKKDIVSGRMTTLEILQRTDFSEVSWEVQNTIRLLIECDGQKTRFWRNRLHAEIERLVKEN